MSAWITRFPDKPRVAVKDAIDLAGHVTGAGCVAVRNRAKPAQLDARCLAGIRASGAPIVGKTTLTELCLSPAGDNPALGMPVNPIAPGLVPGGSSSGSAVAVAAGEADVALGTDTGGSVRIPAACCGIVGLKTTWGRIPVEGVWPLAPTLDTVGPLARDVNGVVTGMRLLDPSFGIAPAPARRIGRLRIDDVDPAVEDAVDQALAGLDVHEIDLPGWDLTWEALDAIILGELWQEHHGLLGADGVGQFADDALRTGREVTAARLAAARTARTAWQAEITAAFDEVDLLALPTLVGAPPPVTDFARFPFTRLTAPVNLAGLPALAMPAGPAASLQLVGPANGEGLLCATALTIRTSG